MKEAGVADVERRLTSLGFDGVEVNTRCLLKAGSLDHRAYRDILSDLPRARGSSPERARTLALRGKVFCILEDYPRAERELRASVALDRRRPRVWVWLGEALLFQAQVAGAKKAFETALRLDSRCAWAFFFRAVARSVDDPDSAQEDLRRLLTIARKGEAHDAALILLCLSEAGQRRFPSARRALNRLSRTKLSRARLDDVARAIRALAAGGERTEEAADPAVIRSSALEPAILLLREGKIGAAMRFIAAEAGKLGGKGASFDDYQERFRLELLALDFDKARKTAEWILRRTREQRHLHQLQRPFFGKEFDFVKIPGAYAELAGAALDRYVAAHPKSPWGYYWRDVFRDTVGSGDRDMGDIRRLARLPERLAWMRCHAGYRHLFQEDFHRAIAELELAAAASVPGDWLAHGFRGEAFACLGDLPGALKAFESAARAAPPEQAGAVLAWKGEVLLWSGEYALALEATGAAAGMGAGFAHCWMGGSLVKLDRPAEAVAPLLRAIELTPYDAEARGWLAEAHFRLGRFQESSREIRAAMQDYGRYCSFHLRALEGLVQSALGDRAASRKALDDIPSRFIAAVKEKTALETVTDDGVRQALYALLDLSRGVRRGSYENRVWMRP